MQRLLEIETYKCMAMLTLPLARAVAAAVARIDRELTGVVADMAAERGHEAETLDRLLGMSAEIEHLASTSAFRFGAAGAYEAIVNQRIEVLREERIGGRQLFGEFMIRRFDPAMRTCRSAKERLDELSGRAERAANLLRTRVDVSEPGAERGGAARRWTGGRRCSSGCRRRSRGCRWWRSATTRSTSPPGCFAPLAEPVGIEKPALLAVLTIPVVAIVWLMVRRIRAGLGPGARDAERPT